ncbi:MAG TPA: ribosome biogenesis GTP-binding protein YihA/YsxC [Thermodesulfobacteriota bacterium]
MKVTRAEFLTSATGPKGYPRGDRPEVAFAGRSNVGKSSLINALVRRKGLVKTSSTPGRTQLLNFFLVNDRLVLVDLPGYGYAKVPESVRAAFGPMIEEYLTRRAELAGVVVILDIRREPSAQDLALLEWLEAIGRRSVVVLTKADKLSGNERARQLRAIRAALPASSAEPIVVSAQTGEGMTALWRAIGALVEGRGSS